MSLLLLVASQTQPMPDGASLGSVGVLEAPPLGEFGSTGSLTVSQTFQIEEAAATFTSVGVFSTDGGLQVLQQDAVAEAVNAALYQAPTVLTFTVTGGWPADDVTVDVDGTVLLTTVLDSDGALAPTSVAIDATLGTVGSHTLTVTSLTGDPGYTTSFPFTIEIAPPPDAVDPGADADPVIVPGADTGTGVYKWVLQDLAPSGIGSYVFPANPLSMTSPHGARVLQQSHTTSAVTGQFHISEPGAVAQEWQFAGVCTTQAFYDKLVQFYELPRRFYLIDHRNRAWKVAFTSLDFKARKRTNLNGSLTDWVHDYTVSALIFDTDWKVPL